MKHFVETVTNQFNIPLAFASVQVNIHGGGAAIIYSDNVGTVSPNPVLCDGSGRLNFYAPDGRYDLIATSNGVTTTVLDVEISDLLQAGATDNPWVSENLLFVNQGSSLSTPPAGRVSVYSKTATKGLYYKDETGLETGPLGTGGGGGGTPGGANTQLQFNNSGTFAGASGITTDGTSIFAKGPNPQHDISAYEGVPGLTCFNPEMITGSMTSGSHTLTVSGGTWTNGCYVGVANAGAATSLSAPTIASVVFTPAAMQAAANGFVRTSNVVTVTLTNDASIAVGDTVVVSGATGCGVSPNGTFVVSSTGWIAGANNPAGNTFTYAQTAANDTACGGNNGDGTGPATITVQAGTSHYSYKIGVLDFNNGMKFQATPTTVTNSVPILQGMEPNVVTINCVTGGASYPVWRQTAGAGNYQYIGSALPCPTGYARTTTTLTDYGQTFGAGSPPQIPVGLPVINPSADLNQILISQITAGGGTLSLTLAGTASASVTSVITYHDNTTAFNAALTAARTDVGGGTVYVPPTVSARFCNIDLTTVPSFPNNVYSPGVTIAVAGAMWPACVIHKVRGEYKLIGIGNSAGNNNFNQSVTNTLFTTGDLNPTIFDESNQSVIKGFTFGANIVSSPNGGLAAYTAIYAANVTDGIYEDLAMGGNANAISPGFILDGCSGSGGNFGDDFTRLNSVGSVNFPVPSMLIRCSGDMVFNTMFIGQRPIVFDATALVQSGGNIAIYNFTTEAIHEMAAIVTDWTNISNTGGVFVYGVNQSDPLYGFGAIVRNVVTNNSGFLLISGSGISNNLIVGAQYQGGVSFQGVGESGLGIQSKGLYSKLDGFPIFNNGAGINRNAMAIQEGSLAIGGNPSAGNVDAVPGLTVVDQTSGRTGLGGSTIGNSGGDLVWLDSNDPSVSTFHWTSNDNAVAQISFQTPNFATDAKILVAHGSSGNLLRLSMSGQNVNLWGGASGAWSAGDLSVPGAVGIGGNANPTRLISSATSARNVTFPDAQGVGAVITGATTNGHAVNLSVSGGVVTLVDGGAPAGGGTVTSVATTSPITGGPITSTGTIACATCTTNSASLTSGALILGAGGQQIATGDLVGDVTTSGNHTAVVNNITNSTMLGKFDWTGIAAPSSAASGHANVYVDSTNLVLSSKNSSGVVSSTVVPKTSTSHQWFSALSASGVLTASQPAFTDISGSLALTQIANPTTNGDIVCGSGGVWAECTPGRPVDAQTGTSYAWPSTDREYLLTMNNGSATALSLAQAGTTGFANNWNAAIGNLGAGLVTLTPATSTVNGSATAKVPQNWWGFVYSDNTNYLMPTFPSIGAFPNCTDSTGNHLNYTASTGAFSCGTSTPASPTLTTVVTAGNCSSSASPAVCSSSAAGSVVIAAGATTVQVNTSAVTANSQIFVFPDETLGTKLGVTCNSTLATAASGLAITARSAGTSFTVSTTATIAVNPVCLSYLIVN